MRRNLTWAWAVFRGSGIAQASFVYLAMVLLIVLFSGVVKSEDVLTIYDIMGGIAPPAIVGDIDYVALSRWLLLLFLPLLMIGKLADKENSLIVYSALRVGGYRRMWRLTQWSVVGHAALYVGMFAAVSLAYVLAAGEKTLVWRDVLLMVALIFVQIGTICSISSWLCEKYKNPAPGIVLMIFAIGLTYMLAQHVPRLRPYAMGTWGMYLEGRTGAQSQGHIFAVSIFVQLALTACACLIPPRRSLY